MSRARRVVHETPGTCWDLVVRAPSTPLVTGLCGYEERTRGPCRRTEFPALGAVLIFDFGALRVGDSPGGRRDPPTHHRGGFVAGIGDRPSTTEHDGLSRGLQVNLPPLVARRILGVPMGELANRVVAVDDLLPTELRARLEDAADWDARFDLVEAFVAERAAATAPVPPVVRWGLGRIEASGGRLDVGALSRESGHSPRFLIDRFREHLGMPPKRIARLVRFDAVIRYLKRGGSAEWGEVAHRFGFADQSHLNREIRAFAGQTPTELRRAVGEVGETFG